MASRIQGITVEIGEDPTKLQTALSIDIADRQDVYGANAVLWLGKKCVMIK